MPTDYTLLQITGTISFSDLDTQCNSTSVTPIVFSDYYRTTANSSSGGASGINNINPNTGVPTSGVMSLSDFYGAGSRFYDQDSITDLFWGTNDIEFTAGFDTGGTLKGYTDYGSSTGGTDFGTPTDTTLSIVNIASDAATTSGGIMIATDGPDAPYFYFYVSTGHADAGTSSGQIQGSGWTVEWYALLLERIAGSGGESEAYFNASQASALNGTDDLWGWFWDTNDGVLQSSISVGNTYRVRKLEAGW